MRYIPLKKHELEDKEWLKKSDELTAKLIDLHKQGDIAGRNKLIESNAKHWGQIKKWLFSLSHNKCWFSESRDNFSHMHVEHFRPKLEAKDLKGKSRDGYWWLAFDYRNYRACGSVGNIKKGGWFPLKDGSLESAFDNQCDESESCYLLDPIDADDVALLAFNDTGNAIPAPGCSEWGAERVYVTITRLKLNEHEFLPEARRRVWSKMTREINLYLEALGKSCKGNNPGAKRDAASHADAIFEMTQEDAEFSSVARWCALFRNDPHINPLVG